jgi:hypothetical protein
MFVYLKSMKPYLTEMNGAINEQKENPPALRAADIQNI